MCLLILTSLFLQCSLCEKQECITIYINLQEGEGVFFLSDPDNIAVHGIVLFTYTNKVICTDIET